MLASVPFGRIVRRKVSAQFSSVYSALQWFSLFVIVSQKSNSFSLLSYGDHGQQLVNVTYDGNKLVATKVTGDRNVPRGEVSFVADLNPTNSSVLDPINISAGELPRFPGQGQVSRKNFKDNRMVDGQMILIEDDQFSFVWSPTKHHVHFKRPSQETTLRLLRDIMAKEDEIENMRDHVSRCFEMDMTTCIARQQDPDNFEPFRRISTQTELDMVEKSLSKSKASTFSFWQVSKWKKYIDKTLDRHDK